MELRRIGTDKGKDDTKSIGDGVSLEIRLDEFIEINPMVSM